MLWQSPGKSRSLLREVAEAAVSPHLDSPGDWRKLVYDRQRSAIGAGVKQLFPVSQRSQAPPDIPGAGVVQAHA
jgi:hypothetical protein